jgi:DnaJ-class molecular chaperone
MAEKNYYRILEIDPDEDERKVRTAFRRLAKLYHPDCGGEECRARFEDIREAYETLSDQDRRRAYDRRTGRGATGFGGGRRLRPEPLLRPSVSARGKRGKTFKDILDDLFASAGTDDFDVEIAVTREEAVSGSVWNLRVPAEKRTCPICRDWFFPCGYCKGARAAGEFTTVRVALPPGLRRDTIFLVYHSGMNRPIRLCARILY